MNKQKRKVHIPISIKLGLSFVCLIIPLFFFTIFSFFRISSNERLYSLTLAENSITEIKRQLQNQIFTMENKLSFFILNSEVYETLINNNLIYNTGNFQTKYAVLNDTIEYYSASLGVNEIRLYADLFIDDFYFSRLLPLSNEKQSVWLGKAKSFANKNIHYFWHETKNSYENKKYLSLSRFIYGKDGDYKSELAIVQMLFDEKLFKDTISVPILTGNSMTFLLNNDIIISSSIDLEKEYVHQFIMNTNAKTGDTTSWVDTYFLGSKVVAKLELLSDSGWSVLTVIPENDLVTLSIRTKNEIQMVLFVITLIILILGFVILKSSLARIYKLRNAIYKVQKGQLPITFSNTGNDEISELMDSFSEMSKELEVLIKEKYIMGQNVRKAEFELLQTQINPHFLYNSLELINCIALKNKIPEINSTVTELAKFYKISLSKGSNIIPLENELKHAELYIAIQNRRFDNSISFNIDVNNNLFQFSILKIILQPIIENSILHGIFEKDSCKGKITIKGELVGDNIEIVIEDDGVGMSLEKIEMITNTENKSSFGIQNTICRIKSCYGPEYGIEYSSVLGKGTIAKIRIPAKKL